MLDFILYITNTHDNINISRKAEEGENPAVHHYDVADPLWTADQEAKAY
jgi:hypothetical protein